MKLLPFQREAIDKTCEFLDKVSVNKARLLSVGLPLSGLGTMAWNEFFPGTPYSELICDDGTPLPSVSVCIPTGGGKTIIGLFASIRLLEQLDRGYDFIVWMVPSDAIYQQVLRDFSPGGKYYVAVSNQFGKNINLLTTSSVWTDADLEPASSVTILLLGKGALIRSETRRSALLVYRNPDKVSSLSVLAGEKSPSLFELMQIIKPIFVVDESHKIYTQIGREFFRDVKVATFMLELSATPKSYDDNNSPNIIYSASGPNLIEQQLIKNTISYNATAGLDIRELIQNVIGLQDQLQSKFDKQGIPVIPRVLISVEFTGETHKNETSSVEAIRSLLTELGITADQIVIKSTENDELGDRDLDNTSDPAKYILTKTALMEGWDCKSVYILVLLNKISAPITNFQIVGRGLRQPFKTYFNDPSLNTLYVVTNSQRHDDSVTTLIGFLADNGLSNLGVMSTSSQNISGIVMNLDLVTDPWVNYLDFDFDHYSSIPFRLKVQRNLLEHTDEIVRECDKIVDAEAVQVNINMQSGVSGPMEHRTLSFNNNELLSETGLGRLRLKLFAKLRNNFFSSSAAISLATAICEDLAKNKPSVPSEQVLIERILGKVSELRTNFINDQFSDVLKNVAKVQSGPFSQLFGNKFEVVAEQDSHLVPRFSNCILGNMPKSLFNGQELDFARFLDSVGSINWMKTTPGFKINFPYPLGIFYPDFLVIPTDLEQAKKNTFYVETKGGHILTSDDSVFKDYACKEIRKLSEDQLFMVFGGFDCCKKLISSVFSSP